MSDDFSPAVNPTRLTGNRQIVPTVARSQPFILVALALLLVVAFASFSSGIISRANIFLVQRGLAVDLIVAFAQLMVLAVGGINIAVGATGVAAAMVAGWAMQSAALPIGIAIAMALATGAAIGAAAGLVVVRARINSFIVTLTLASIIFGATVLATKATGFNQLPPAFVSFGRERLAGGYLTPLFLFALIVAAAASLLLHFSVLGRAILLTGANPRVAHASGVRTGRIIAFCQAASGFLAAAAGVVLMLRNGAAIPSMAGNLGEEWLLPSFIIPILGGTSMFGGKVSISGCFAAALLIAVIRSGLLMSGVSDFYVEMCFGAVLLVAVIVSRYAATSEGEGS
jgi:ribose transport system permease protein